MLKRKPIITTLLLTFSISIFASSAKIVKADEISDAKPPTIHGKAAVTIDYDTGEVIYAKNGDEKKYPASTTKLMTGLLLAENKSPNDSLEYTQSAKKQPEYALNVNFKPQTVGSKMSADDVMKALLMFSANDAAYMISDSVSGNSKAFSDLMNNKAKEIGMINTHFITPNGLHNDDHYSTAYDLSVLGRAAFENSWVSDVMKTDKAQIHLGDGSIVNLENRNKGLGKDGNIGGKTGYTTPAGRCLVSVYERDGRKIVGAVLQSQYDANDQIVFDDMNKIMDYSYKAEKVPAFKAGTEIDKITVNYKPFKFFGPTKTIDVPLVLTEDVSYYNNEINKKDLKTTINITDVDAWNLAGNNNLLKLKVSERVYEKDYNLKANITKGTLFKANIGLYIVSLIVIAVIIILILLIIKLISGRRHRRKRRIRF
ncbi:D-alanyl-D-alanine carboxypeptidase family protein [Clostridium fallax]|uniref:D-alanyl-D-alanine carboxypeptidase n=1 Tax=Clostridium fallax TaxID=1533 RepID=A0A1M4WV92_9CLOT|nr:D-alanyl-D-alanine carboxypeptidase family protein [Clostridium fallax]SHE85154.1 D-alanyl-D-alanine carboxypeptidase [Clostridium fallax]SQB07425.1 D-alanyl-D-alanine carboxypeptidase [Clostridium fallax]